MGRVRPDAFFGTCAGTLQRRGWLANRAQPSDPSATVDSTMAVPVGSNPVAIAKPVSPAICAITAVASPAETKSAAPEAAMLEAVFAVANGLAFDAPGRADSVTGHSG